MNEQVSERIRKFFSDFLIDQVVGRSNSIQGIFSAYDILPEIKNALDNDHRIHVSFNLNDFLNSSDFSGIIAKNLIEGKTVIATLDSSYTEPMFNNFLRLLRDENEFHETLIDTYHLSQKNPHPEGHLILTINIDDTASVKSIPLSEYIDNWLDIRKFNQSI